MDNVTATIEFMYTDNFSTTINTSDKKALKQFFEQSCADIAEEHDETNCISECLLKIVDEENNKKCCICFDIVSVFPCEDVQVVNILFYDATNKNKLAYIDVIKNGFNSVDWVNFYYFGEL